MYVELEMPITHGHKGALNNVKKYFKMCDTIVGTSNHPNGLFVGLNRESSQTITNRKIMKIDFKFENHSSNAMQCQAIQRVFKPIGPTLLKDPLGVGWGLHLPCSGWTLGFSIK
jgi:hypothetical protein